jgi:hypothetical protein
MAATDIAVHGLKVGCRYVDKDIVAHDGAMVCGWND